MPELDDIQGQYLTDKGDNIVIVEKRHTDLAPVVAERQSADSHPARVYLLRLAPSSRPVMRGALNIAAELLTGGQADWETMPWHALRIQHMDALRSELADRYAAATANRMLAAVRGTMRAAWELGQMDTDSYQRALSTRSVRGETLPRGRAVSQGELRALFAVCLRDRDKEGHLTMRGARDAALLALLYGSGLRRAEAADLDVGDYDPASGAVTVRAGKGRKDRICYSATGQKQLMDLWLRLRVAGGAPPSAGPIFLPILKGGHLRVRRLDSRTVFDIVQARAREGGLPATTPHDFRRSMISDLLEVVDISTVQRLAGHANVSTTVRYDRRGEATKRRAAEMLHIPLPQIIE
ncbi:MAG: site-specific integrase [Chloroflexota bacterium]